MTNAGTSAAHAISWIAAWNAHDLEAILDHYTEDVEFQSDVVVRRWGRPDGILYGKNELREHFRQGLELAPNLKFDLEEIFSCPGSYAVQYKRDNGNRVIQVVAINGIGLAKQVRAFYARPQR